MLIKVADHLLQKAILFMNGTKPKDGEAFIGIKTRGGVPAGLVFVDPMMRVGPISLGNAEIHIKRIGPQYRFPELEELSDESVRSLLGDFIWARAGTLSGTAVLNSKSGLWFPTQEHDRFTLAPVKEVPIIPRSKQEAKNSEMPSPVTVIGRPAYAIPNHSLEERVSRLEQELASSKKMQGFFL